MSNETIVVYFPLITKLRLLESRYEIAEYECNFDEMDKLANKINRISFKINKFYYKCGIY